MQRPFFLLLTFFYMSQPYFQSIDAARSTAEKSGCDGDTQYTHSPN